MSKFSDIAKELGYELDEYWNSSWSKYWNQALAQMTGLSNYYVLGEKKAGILNNDLEYIKNSNNIVKGTDKTITDKVSFTYYTNEGAIKAMAESKPLLADPSNDKRSDVATGFTFVDDNHSEYNYQSGRTYKVFSEAEGSVNVLETIKNSSFNSDYESFNNSYGINEDISPLLVQKTEAWFKKISNDYISDRFKTVISRFHTDSNDVDELKNGISNSSFSNTYGMSHGRNLLKTKKSDENGYENPYCRVWTWHHQYNKLNDLIRPFIGSDGDFITQSELEGNYNWTNFRTKASGENFRSGGERLAKYGVMYDNGGKTNGFVNITPSWVEGNYDDSKNVSLKHCMFSIENLAWQGIFKDYNDNLEEFGLSREQKGPLGGRIMWFPPYDLQFNEGTSANWEENVFIGRGEPIYTYSNSKRNGHLSFKLLIDHPAILDYWERRHEIGNNAESGVDDIKSKEQEMLRFFAGCSILKAGDIVENINDPNSDNNNGGNGPDDGNSNQDDGSKSFTFYVFYPNNYSGVDDRDSSKPVYSIDYLINGVGTQYRYDYENDNYEIEFGVNKVNNYISNENITVGGYEMRDKGISIINTIQEGDLITDVTIDGNTISLSKQKDTKTEKYKWAYRVDENTSLQVLLNKTGKCYADTQSFKLNSTGYSKAAEKLKCTDKTIFSLADVYVAVNNDAKNILSGLYDENNVATIKKIISGEDGKITSITCDGMASLQANNESESVNKKRNETLAQSRAETVKEWIKSKWGIGDSVKLEIGTYTVDTGSVSTNRDDVNDEYTKMSRHAKVTVKYGGSVSEDSSVTNISISTGSSVTNNAKVVSNPVDNSNVDNTEEETVDNTFTRPDLKSVRYDNEAIFFNRLTKEDPFMAKLLSERIKYFNPVFHSMSPEGFNARLTFLNQCMHQGPTYSGSDTNNTNANNLAFGKAPVCVLRIGDFYNTKIIINNLQISYDPLTWDMNQEGIGVMPMIATVSLDFNFIGGSDLGGPIQRLQNAISFNYYANTSVYDNRAEEIEYDLLGKTKAFKANTATGNIIYNNNGQE
jgi:hypothetical protein